MKKIVIIIFLSFLLFISGCDNITGRGVTEPNPDENIQNCVDLCNDGTMSRQELIDSCQSILAYGGEKVFNDYLEACKK